VSYSLLSEVRAVQQAQAVLLQGPVASHPLTPRAESPAKQNLLIAECGFTVAIKHFQSEEQSLLKMDLGQFFSMPLLRQDIQRVVLGSECSFSAQCGHAVPLIKSSLVSDVSQLSF